MYHGKSQGSSPPPSQRLSSLQSVGLDSDEVNVGAQVEALLTQLPESVQILEDLFQAFEIDPQVARDLSSATFDLMEEELGAADDRPAPPGNRALLDEVAEVRARMSTGVH